jgi:hypothetical protein
MVEPGQIMPWNFPLLMAAWKLAPALAVGCTGRTSYSLAELCDEVLGSIGAAGPPGAKLEAARTPGSTRSAIG